MKINRRKGRSRLSACLLSSVAAPEMPCPIVRLFLLNLFLKLYLFIF